MNDKGERTMTAAEWISSGPMRNIMRPPADTQSELEAGLEELIWNDPVINAIYNLSRRDGKSREEMLLAMVLAQTGAKDVLFKQCIELSSVQPMPKIMIPLSALRGAPLSERRMEILASPFVGTSYKTGERVDSIDVIGYGRAIEAEHGILAAQEAK